jgi:DNA-binding NarL/FixJ family response regulator
MVKIIIADDYSMIRQGLKLLLQAEPGFRVIGEAANGLQAVDLVDKLHPDILLTDFEMPGLDGVRVIKEIGRTSSKETRAIIFSIHGEKEYVTCALKAGAFGYIVKDSNAEDLIPAIKAVSRGEQFLSPGLAESLQERISPLAQISH